MFQDCQANQCQQSIGEGNQWKLDEVPTFSLMSCEDKMRSALSRINGRLLHIFHVEQAALLSDDWICVM